MRVIEFKQFGEPSELHVTDRPDPIAGDSTAVVRVEAASVNPSDVKNVAGRMSKTTLPRVPGRDYSGVVVDGPAEWIGADVWGTGGDVGFTRDGTHAELLAVPLASLVRKPNNLSHGEAGAVGVTFVTAWSALAEYAELKSGETIVIFGSSGGVGGAAVQIARHLGARVVGINRSAPPPDSPSAKLTDLLLDSGSADLVSSLRAATDGRGADVVFNAAGGPMFGIGLGLLAHGGRQVEITSPTERNVTLDLVDFYHNESRLLGLDTLKRDLTDCSKILELLREGFEKGLFLAPAIAAVLPLGSAQQAYERVARGERGRVVLIPSLE